MVHNDNNEIIFVHKVENEEGKRVTSAKVFKLNKYFIMKIKEIFINC